jgi:phasin
MTATSTPSTKHAASPFDRPKYETPKSDAPNMEVPAAFRELADKGVAQTKDNYQKVQAVAADMMAIFGETYSTAAKSAANYNLKVMEMARTNADSAFDFAFGLMGTKSLPEMVALSTEQARKQFDLISAQNKELWSLAQNMATETAEPIKQGFTKALAASNTHA